LKRNRAFSALNYSVWRVIRYSDPSKSSKDSFRWYGQYGIADPGPWGDIASPEDWFWISSFHSSNPASRAVPGTSPLNVMHLGLWELEITRNLLECCISCADDSDYQLHSAGPRAYSACQKLLGLFRKADMEGHDRRPKRR